MSKISSTDSVQFMFEPDLRVCKNCDEILQLNFGLEIGEAVSCECGAFGAIVIFPCGKFECTCAGYLGISWTGAVIENILVK